MNKISKLAILGLLSISTAAAIAGTSVTLPGGKVAPGSELYIPVSNLLPAKYNVKCQVQNDSAEPVTVAFDAAYNTHAMGGYISVNGQAKQRFSPFDIPAGTNTLAITQLSAGGNDVISGQPRQLRLRNFDNSNSLTVVSCQAVLTAKSGSN